LFTRFSHCLELPTGGPVDYTGRRPTREDVKSSEEEGPPCQTVRPSDTGGGDLLGPLARIFSRHPVRLMRRVRGQRPGGRRRLRKNSPFSEIAGRSAFGPEADVHEQPLSANSGRIINYCGCLSDVCPQSKIRTMYPPSASGPREAAAI